MAVHRVPGHWHQARWTCYVVVRNVPRAHVSGTAVRGVAGSRRHPSPFATRTDRWQTTHSGVRDAAAWRVDVRRHDEAAPTIRLPSSHGASSRPVRFLFVASSSCRGTAALRYGAAKG